MLYLSALFFGQAHGCRPGAYFGLSLLGIATGTVFDADNSYIG